jgi:hypothetical protein
MPILRLTILLPLPRVGAGLINGDRAMLQRQAALPSSIE